MCITSLKTQLGNRAGIVFEFSIILTAYKTVSMCLS